MKYSALILIILTLITCCYSGRLPIQAHSFNDLDYVINLLSRGVDYYKMDVSMANRKSCEKHSTWNKSLPCIKTSQYLQQICCLAMRGDASSRPDFNYPFNTSTDFVRLLETTLAKIVVNQPKRIILFAVNFQYKHTFDDNITQSFLSALVDVMAKYPHNLLLGTGMDDFILQYDRICYGKGAPQCTQTRRKISKSAMFLQSGGRNPFDPRDYYKRFRNFNVYYKGVDGYCKDGFPQWMNNHPQFPIIFWEPSDEKQVQRVISQLLSPACMKKHNRNLSGIAIATNIDPEMVDIYMRKTIQPITFSNWLLPNNFASLSWSFNTQKLLASEQINYRLTKIKSTASSETVFSASTNIFTNRLLLQRWQHNSTIGTMQLTKNRQISSLFSDSQVIQSVMQDSMGRLVLITYRKAGQSKTYYVYYFDSASFDLASGKEWSRIDAATMRGNQMIYLECDSQNINCTIRGAIEFKQTKVYAQFQARLFFSAVTGIQYFGNENFIVVGHSSSKPGVSSAIIIERGQVIPPQLPLSYGQNPKIFKKQSGKQYGVLLSNAMCHCAVLFNNNNHNKCNFFKEPQLQSMRNVRGIVNLLQFDLAQLRKNTQIISPCHPSIKLYKVMIGTNTDILELPSLGSYLMASQYQRVEDQDFMASLFCGASNFDIKFKYKLKSSILTGMYLTNYVPKEHKQQKVNVQIQ